MQSKAIKIILKPSLNTKIIEKNISKNNKAKNTKLIKYLFKSFKIKIAKIIKINSEKKQNIVKNSKHSLKKIKIDKKIKINLSKFNVRWIYFFVMSNKIRVIIKKIFTKYGANILTNCLVWWVIMIIF